MGTPNRDGRRLFEKIILEGAQAGLSWITILKRRENYRRLFDGFDPVKIAAYDEDDVKRLMGDAGIIRNQAKIRSAINNAKVFVEHFGDDEDAFSEFNFDKCSPRLKALNTKFSGELIPLLSSPVWRNFLIFSFNFIDKLYASSN